MDIDSMIAVLMAAKEGKAIQWRSGGSEWYYCCDLGPTWDFQSNEYRVKPEPEPVKRWIEIATRGDDTYLMMAHDIKEAHLELEFIDGKLVGAKVL